MSQLQLDLQVAEAARDRGLSTTTIANLRWIAQALEDLGAFARARGRLTLEEYRSNRAARGLPEPTSHHAWGALAQVAAKRRVLVFTGEYQKARSKRTHAHPVKVWRPA